MTNLFATDLMLADVTSGQECGLVIVILLLGALTAVMLDGWTSLDGGHDRDALTVVIPDCCTSGQDCRTVMVMLLFALPAVILFNLQYWSLLKSVKQPALFAAPLEILPVIANKLIGITSLAPFSNCSGITVYLGCLTT